jgi:hypothetical protein
MIIINPIVSLLYFVGLALDITMFFLLVRLIQIWRPVNWLIPFDKVGRPLVDGITSIVRNFGSSKFKQRLTEKAIILISISILILVNLLLTGLLRPGN